MKSAVLEEELHGWRLRSTVGIDTAHMLRIAKDGYAMARAKGAPVAPFIAMFADGYQLGVVLAERILSGATASFEDGPDVTLLLSQQDVDSLKGLGHAVLIRLDP